MFIFTKIQDVKGQVFAEIYAIYLQSFPVCERRSLASIEKIINSSSRFEISAIYKENMLVGFINYWKFDMFIYIEHFAIKAEFRNNNIGSVCLQTFLKRNNLPIILEVEIENSDIAKRRIRFYERLGFVLHLNEYQQPPYDGISQKIPMHIMSNNFDFVDERFYLIKNKLYNEVYDYCN